MFSKFPKLILLALICFLYFPTLNGPYTLDDFHTVQNNPIMRAPDNWITVWTSGKAYSSLATNWGYRPITATSNLLLWKVGSGETWPFHVFKWLIFFGLCLTLLSIWKRLAPGVSNTVLIAGIWLYAVNPVHTQVLSYIAATSSLLAAVFIALTILTWLKFRERGGTKYLILSLIFGFCCPLAKEEGLIYLALLPLTEFYMRSISGQKWFDKKALTLLLFLIPFSVAGYLLSIMREPTTNIGLGSIPPWVYFMTQWRAYLRYIAMYFVPYSLNADNLEFGFSWEFLDLKVIAALIANLAILGFAFVFRKKFALVAFAIFWFYIGILPGSSLWPLAEPVNDHRSFNAYLGFSLVFLFVLHKLSQLNERAFRAVVLVLLCVYSGLTFQRSFVWADSEKIWQDVVDKNPSSVRAMNNLARVFMNKERFRDALQLLSRCVDTTVPYAYCYINRAVVNAALANEVQALADFERAIQMDFGKRESYYNLALHLSARGFLTRPFALLKEADEFAQGNDLAVRIEMIDLAKKMGDVALASDLFQKSIATFGSHPQLMLVGRMNGIIR